MPNITVLGAGLVGGPMALDLAVDKSYKVRVFDVSDQRLQKLSEKRSDLTCVRADLSDAGFLRQIAGESDYLVNALPGHLGYKAFRSIIEAKKPVVDIAFFAEDPLPLDQLAKEHGVTAIMDMGVAPGMSNVLMGHAFRELDTADSAAIYVGGLPLLPASPWKYKAPFSPLDVIQEYTRPSRFVRDGVEQIVPPLSLSEFIEFDQVGRLEGSITDGLRSLVKTLNIPNMAEWTLRYPGHFDLIRRLQAAGLFEEQDISWETYKSRVAPFVAEGVVKTDLESFGQSHVSPVEVTSRLLISEWHLHETEKDLTVMRVSVDGTKNNRKQRVSYDLYDEHDASTGTHSMARVTGYTATMALRMVEQGLYRKPGVTVPEVIGLNHPECVEFLLEGLKERGVVYQKSVTEHKG